MNIMRTKQFLLKLRTPVPALGLLSLMTALSGTVQSQESLGGLGAASGISASMSGMSSSGALSAGSNMRNSANGMGSGSEMEMADPSLNGMGGSGGASGGLAPATIAPPKPRVYGVQRGSALLGELMAGQRKMPKIPSPIGKSRSSRAQAELSKRIKNMNDAQRKKLVMQKYDIRPKNWLAHYLKEDRYKITSGLWGFMTTRTSRFYYRPWSVAMLKADPNHVIGFRTWHDAMLAGYRPDPGSLPEPARQLLQMASYSKGEGMLRYIEFVYAGQVSPAVFDRNYQYVAKVAGALNDYKRRYPSTPSMLDDTVNKVILASLGQGRVPTSVGGPPAPPPNLNGGMNGQFSTPGSSSSFGSGSMSSSGSSSSSSSSSSGSGNREDSFNGFSNRAGSLANVPANSGSSGLSAN